MENVIEDERWYMPWLDILTLLTVRSNMSVIVTCIDARKLQGLTSAHAS